MKTVFITVYDGDIEKNILQSAVLRTLEESEIRVVLLVKNGIVHNYRHYSRGNIVVEELPPALCASEKFFYWIGWNILPTYSGYLRRYQSYKLHRNWLRLKLGGLLSFLGRFRMFRQLLRAIYATIPDTYCQELFEKYKPDLMYAPSMFSPEDGRLLRMAKRRGTRTITASKSWDVLTNKAFTRIKADTIMVQNPIIRDIAIRLGDYEPHQVEVVGFVQFDFVVDKSLIMPREEFCKKVGTDPARKILLYSASGDWKNPYDAEVVRGIHDAIESGALANAQVLARFHPKYSSKIEQLNLPHLVKYRPCPGEKEVESYDSSAARVYPFTFGREDYIDLANSLYHADVTINTMSSITLDAIAYDKPVVLICHDGIDRKLPYFESLRRMYDEDHYRTIIEARCAAACYSMYGTIEAIQAYLANPATHGEARAYIREHMLYKLDGNSGARIAATLLRVLK
ncbi:MAG TPA: hypothetical protein VJJ20_02720 [Candidatus Paceibacterota bacterium]